MEPHDKLRETLIGNWISLLCTTYTKVLDKTQLHRPCIEFPFILKPISKQIENLLDVTEVYEEKQILQEAINIIKTYNQENKFSVELKLNKIFLSYLEVIGEDRMRAYFQNLQGLLDESLNNIKTATQMLIELNNR